MQQCSEAIKLYLQGVPPKKIIFMSFRLLVLGLISLKLKSCINPHSFNYWDTPIEPRISFLGKPVFSLLFALVWCLMSHLFNENYLKPVNKIIFLNRSRCGGCLSLEIFVTKPVLHLGIRRCYKILCKLSNLVWVYCFLNDFSLFGINYFSCCPCCHNKNPLKYYSSILRHCNWC